MVNDNNANLTQKQKRKNFLPPTPGFESQSNCVYAPTYLRTLLSRQIPKPQKPLFEDEKIEEN